MGDQPDRIEVVMFGQEFEILLQRSAFIETRRPQRKCGGSARQHAHGSAFGSAGVEEILGSQVNPVRLGTYNTAGNAWSVSVNGHYAYVAEQFSGFQIIDIADSSNPTCVED